MINFPWNVKLFPPGLEPGTFRVLGERDNHYTTETLLYLILYTVIILLDSHDHKTVLQVLIVSIILFWLRTA